MTWREIFNREYRPFPMFQYEPSPEPDVGGYGLGKAKPDQNWKQMWKVRAALAVRWRDGHAAAIYLEGHHDTVYCVQFDE